MMAVLVLLRTRLSVPVSAALTGFGLATMLVVAAPVLRGQTATYTVYSADGRRSLVVRTGTTPESLALEQLTGVFGLTFTEDRAANGLVVGTRKQRIIAVPGQSFVQVGGRVIGLDGPIRRERNAWIAPMDFLTKALGPAIGEPIVVRRGSRLVLVGNVRVPQVAGTVERTAAGARLVLTVQPATPHRVTRDGNRLTVRFDAAALDATPVTGFIPEFASAARIDGPALVVELGSSAASFRADDTPEGITIDLLPPAPAAPPPAAPRPAGAATTPPAPAPQIDVAPTVRTIVLDPGHGGDDAGTKGAGGAVEKDVTLQLARRLKSAIESRLGLRVLLTRETDDTVPVDRRSAFANHNKADLFLSLHANASMRATVRGAQLYSLDLGAYPGAGDRAEARQTVPLLGGGSRVIDPMPWDRAQIPFADQSAAFAALVIQEFAARSVPLHGRPAVIAPMRVLAGANMPAVLIEFGFLSNAEDEKALSSAEGQAALIESVVAAIAQVRRGIPATSGEGRQ